MNDSPINTFFMRMRSFNIVDVAVLFMLVSAQENSAQNIISPRFREAPPVPLDGMDDDQYCKSIKRLERAGEIKPVELESVRGFVVTRFVELQDYMTDFGRRRYQRLKAREARSK